MIDGNQEDLFAGLRMIGSILDEQAFDFGVCAGVGDDLRRMERWLDLTSYPIETLTKIFLNIVQNLREISVEIKKL